MKKTVAIFDLDNTITRKDTYLAFLLSVLLTHPARVFRTIGLPFAVIAYKIKLKDNSWLKETFLSAVMGGLNRNQVNSCRDKFIEKLLLQGTYKDALDAISKHREAGHQLVMATASFHFYTEKLGKKLGFEKVVCTQAEWSENQLTGKIKGGNCYGLNKLNQLTNNFEPRESYKIIAYSDHHSDEPFLQWADIAYAINPTAKLKKIAEQQAFTIQQWQ
jgi:HAD superfamily hydrolase (TIGR01490 family)